MTDAKKEFLRTLKFVLFSISAGLIQVVAEVVMLELVHAAPWLSYLVALVLSVLWNFTLNRNITFRSAGNVPAAMLKVACYYVVFTPLSTWGGDALTAAGWNEYLVLAISMATNFITEFLYDRFFVFGKTIDTAKKKR